MLLFEVDGPIPETNTIYLFIFQFIYLLLLTSYVCTELSVKF